MKKFLSVLVVMFCASAMFGAENDWVENFDTAKKMSASAKKLILIDFTGSDWCGWCIKLDKEVFAKPEFKKYAADNFILVKIDFPRKKKLSSEQQQNNRSLAEKYNVEGFPTVLLLDSSGKELARTGYFQGTAADYVEHLKDLQKNIPK
jgi:protein disulfide-isomerase